MYEFFDMCAYEASTLESEFLDSFAEWWGETCLNDEYGAQTIDISFQDRITQDFFWLGENADSSLAGVESGAFSIDSEPQGIFESIQDIWSSLFPTLVPFESGLVRAEDFTRDGTFDTANNCEVVGRVDQDIAFLQQQTGETCSLMSQEQFLHRATGETLTEAQLEELAAQLNIYAPGEGTSPYAMGTLLDLAGVPNLRNYNAEIQELLDVVAAGNDALISVDAREFYNDPSFPPGSGHAVAINGYGKNPETGEFAGFYVTDSNYSGTARFVTMDDLSRSWHNRYIAVSESIMA